MSKTKLGSRIQQAAGFIKKRIPHPPVVGLVFGSALADHFILQLKDPLCLPFETIPHFQKSTVPGHAGKLYFGYIHSVPVIVGAGRFHLYEGYSPAEVAFPIRVYEQLGITSLILTNAAGALNPRFKSGSMVLIQDHLNLTGQNPLMGENDLKLGARFVDMSSAYSPVLNQKIERTARKIKQKMEKGIYVGITGPSYETPAEIRMFRKLGGDCIGMSTLMEVIAAAHQRLPTAVISCITNELSLNKKVSLSHEQVVKQAKQIQVKLSNLLVRCLCDHP